MSNVGVAKYWVPACVKAHCREALGWVPKGYYFGLVRREFPSCRVFLARQDKHRGKDMAGGSLLSAQTRVRRIPSLVRIKNGCLRPSSCLDTVRPWSYYQLS